MQYTRDFLESERIFFFFFMCVSFSSFFCKLLSLSETVKFMSVRSHSGFTRKKEMEKEKQIH